MTGQLFGEPIEIINNSTKDDFYMDYIEKFSDDPIMILNLDDIIKKIENWKVKFPRVRPFYAMKCNPNEVVLKLLISLGCGFDCASSIEMQKMIGLGVSPSKIIFAHPCKPKSHIEVAATLGIDKMTFDNEEELYKIKSIYPSASLVLRIGHSTKNTLGNLGEKFGANRKEVPLLLKIAKELGLNVIGVSFHVGSNCNDPLEYVSAIAKSREVFDQAIDLGFNPYLVDIGGGFPGNTGSSIKEIATHINNALEKYFSEDNIQVISEPGSYVVSSAFTLLTPVTSRKKKIAENGEAQFMYYVNDGIHGSFETIPLINQIWKPIPLLRSDKGRSNCLYASQLWGATCNGIDKISNLEMLPELHIGDWLMWEDMGAYSLSFQTNFNGFPSPKVFIVTSQSSWMKLQSKVSSIIV